MNECTMAYMMPEERRKAPKIQYNQQLFIRLSYTGIRCYYETRVHILDANAYSSTVISSSISKRTA